MASILYAKGAERLLTGQVNFSSAAIKVALVTNAYSLNADDHEFLTSLGANTIGTHQTLANKVVAGRVFDADDATWLAVASGSTIKAAVLFVDTGVGGTSPLLAYIDDIAGFPAATNGSDITVQWSNGPSKIFALVSP